MGKIWSSGSAVNKSAVAEGPTRATPNLSNPLQKVREVETRLQHLRQPFRPALCVYQPSSNILPWNILP